MEESRRLVGFRFMNRFRCIAAACEETCCAGWAVPIDEPHYEAIRHAMSGSESERAEFARAIESKPDTRYRSAALIVLRDDGSCSLLDSEKLCSLQRRYGEAVLPDICAAYPRVASQAYDRIEVGASISCPEMARLALLAEDATELVDLDAEKLGRLRIFFNLEQPKDLYEAAFEDVRALLMYLLAQRRFSMATRLFFMMFFAQKSREFLHRNGTRETGMRLAQMIKDAGHPDVLANLQQKFRATQFDNPFALSVVTQILSATAKNESPGYRRTLAEVLDAYIAQPESGVTRDEKGAAQFDLPKLHAYFQSHQPMLSAAQLSRIDLYVENFCTNFVWKDWYLRAPTLVRHLMGLLVRVATLRFLLLSHPVVQHLSTSGLDPEAQQQALDKVAVQVFYSASRTIDHAEPLLKAVHESLAEQNMETLPHAICLIQL